jgi:F0F1-type ATP synthase membrane subunit c/vacuolar-type H+-ATPase subunit K
MTDGPQMDANTSNDLSMEPAQKRAIRILYAALFASIGAYWMVLMKMTTDPNSAGNTLPENLVNILKIAAGLVFVLTLMSDKFMRKPAAATPPAGQYFVALILRLALCESIAIFGFVLGIMGATKGQFLPFFLVSAVAFVMAAPTDGAYERFVLPWRQKQRGVDAER